ncbi:MAG: hypothetical protein WCO19_01460 [Candidatus Saccharibacteria bacterium]
MKPDFDPYDLTPRVLPNAEPAPPPPPKPTIRRISMGPIFHSKITKGLALILGAILAALIGYSGASYMITKKQAQSTSTIVAPTQKQSSNPVTASTSVAQPTVTKTEAASIPQPTPTTSTQTTVTPSNNASAPAAKVFCGVSGMPEGVCTVITSIEQKGLKNNPYVTADTSQVPANSTVTVDESSWKKIDDTRGDVLFNANLGGVTYNGKASLQSVGGSWKAVAYTLN